MGDFASGGLGSHEILRLPDGDFAVAYGGTKTHPDFQRAKLNLPTIQTNLSIQSPSARLQESWAFKGAMHQNSIRHIDADRREYVFAALQWQGSPDRVLPLVARFTSGRVPRFLPHLCTERLGQYAGSISVSLDGGEVAVTGPKGDPVLFLEGSELPLTAASLNAASGVTKAVEGLVITVAGGLTLWQPGQLPPVPVDGGWF